MESVARRLWEGWKRVAKRIGAFQARILMLAFYFVVLCPFALVVRWRSDPLGIKTGAPRGWRTRTEGNGDRLELARRQY